MFGLMVGVTRNEFAIKFYQDKGNAKEASAYQVMLENAKKDLATMVPESVMNTDE